jgi:Asp-tRNA(Asn)/Glu-tRNA(Gln) amidotransferase A subunit family amidase
VTDPFEKSAVAACAAIRRRDVSVQELTSHFLARIERGNCGIRALRHVMADRAIEAAGVIDARIRAGEALPLAGLPFVVKENCDTVGAPCSAGLPFRRNHWPSMDSWIVARLRAAGAIILGISVSDPGAFSVRTAEVTHPSDPALTVGGSSGGSAAALAAGFCLGAIGTDTGGSIRIPSACCGTVGLKPTFGSLPMDGIFPLVTSLDHVGPMAGSIDDVSLVWQALATSTQAGSTPSRQRVGYDPAWVEVADQPIRTAFDLALERLSDQDITTIEIRLPDLEDVVAMHGQIFLPEAFAYHCAHHGENIDRYPAIAREWFAHAREMRVGTYSDACVRRVAMTRHIDELLEEVDAIVTPTLCIASPPKHAERVTIAGVEHDFTMGLVRLTCLFDHTGHPALAAPVGGAPDKLASSLQIIGPYGGEATVLRYAKLL